MPDQGATQMRGRILGIYVTRIEPGLPSQAKSKFMRCVRLAAIIVVIGPAKIGSA